jgi:DnaK suppressor protein
MSLGTVLSFDKYVLLQFKSGLREQQRELQQVIDQAEENIRNLADSEPHDIADAASGVTLERTVIAQSSQDRTRLRLVELALERIRLGTFGICADCGDPISIKRLQAIPWASHCIHCQEKHEQGGSYSEPLTE